jgi:hypothetical protein
MATKRNTSGGARRATSAPNQAASNARDASRGGNKNDEFNLPAEPEVTQRRTTAGTSNPGRDPAGGAAARAARARAIRENTMRNQPSNRSESPCASRSMGMGAFSLIAGTGIGAALMYQLDPEAGQERRAHLRSTAAHAAERSGDVLHNAWDMASEKLSPLAERAAEMGSSGMSAASSLGARLAERADDTAHSMHRSARRQMRHARDAASGWFGHEEQRSYVPSAGTALSAMGALALGVGAMYLLDPTDGARRRAMMRDKATRCLNETGDFFRRTGRHLANRSRGMAHQTRAMFEREDVTDRQLAERIRSRIGHLQQQSTVHVACLNGRATITGCCTPADVDALLATIQSTPGVASIVNLLDVRNQGETASFGGTTNASPTA